MDTILLRMFKIRAAQPKDLPKFQESFANNKHLRIFNASLFNKLQCTMQNLIPHNLRLLPSIHLAVDGNIILGFVILRLLSGLNNSWQIDEVFVVDEMKNEELSEELVRYILSVYGSYGVEHFLMEVDLQNSTVISMLHKCGFRRYAKVYLYNKSMNINTDDFSGLLMLDKNFIVRVQTKNDLSEVEKLYLSSIPPELRPILGKSKDYFRQQKESLVIVDKPRNLIIAWATVNKVSYENYLIELIAASGWTYLYEQFLNTIILTHLPASSEKTDIIVKATDYTPELITILKTKNFIPIETKELLIKTVWQKAKGGQSKLTRVGKPSIAPT